MKYRMVDLRNKCINIQMKFKAMTETKAGINLGHSTLSSQFVKSARPRD